ALGTATGLEARLVPARGYDLELVPRVPLPRRATPALLLLPGRVAGAVRVAGRVLDRVGADVVVGFGGYVALPAYLAAGRRRLPIVVHEANSRPGLANRVGARLTPWVAVGTPETRLPRARYVGLPLRRAIADLDRPALRGPARESFGLDAERPTLLVFGGSQGARRLNETAAAAAPSLAAAGVQVLHATGHGHEVHTGLAPDADLHADPDADLDAPRYLALPYLDRMELAYAAADLALCRAGAMTCAELAAVGLPAAYVPLPHGNGEQELNARPVVGAGGGLLVRDADLTPDWVRDHVIPLLTDPLRLSAMSRAAAAFGRRDADETLVDMVLAAAGRTPEDHR
nr:UDP-N-acetylglucosamine--N-acetylmuramyl-(pentapeptide) pyrophosphoryl-undecaprenol N-acetylglucosamine transferase [Acidothermales bacterium]